MRIFLSLFTLASTSILVANPQGIHSIIGDATCHIQDFNTLEISVGKNSIIEWESFSIDAHEITKFVMPDAHTSVLNRVMGSSMSMILGKLESNGQVFLINPNGVLVGEGAIIDTASFIASSFDILNEDFINGNRAYCVTDAGSVINLGTITASDVQLVGYDVANHGSIDALKVQETQGRVFLISEHSTETSGLIHAPGGEIRLLGDYISLSGAAQIDVSDTFGGGTVLIGGDYQGKNPEVRNANFVVVDEQVTISADALVEGDGGKVILWGNQATHFFGHISSKGGQEGGNGGFIEVSSEGLLGYHGIANTLAPHGKTGTLLLDPPSLTISNAFTSYNIAFNGMYCPLLTYCITNTSNGTLNADDLSYALSISDVTVMASGDITLAEDVSIVWSSTNSLSLQAGGVVNIDGSIRGGGNIIISGENIQFLHPGLTEFPNIISGNSIFLNATSDILVIAGNTSDLPYAGIVFEALESISVTATQGLEINNQDIILGFITFSLVGPLDCTVSNTTSMTFTIGQNFNINSAPTGQGSLVAFTFHGGDFIVNVGNDINWQAGEANNGSALYFADVGEMSIEFGGTFNRSGDIITVPCTAPPPPPPPPPPAPSPLPS